MLLKAAPIGGLQVIWLERQCLRHSSAIWLEDRLSMRVYSQLTQQSAFAWIALPLARQGKFDAGS